MPYLINPSSGYIVSANNHMSSDNVKHGITESFTFTGRKTRISEMIEEAFIRTNNKVVVRDMQLMHTDVLDVQARESLPDMLYCAAKATLALSEKQKLKI
jgi:penicillin amidase